MIPPGGAPALSSFEEVDPPPGAADHGRGRRWEALLAAAVLGAVLLFGIGDWLSQEARAQAYHAGAAAAAMRHWEAAQTAFAAAAGYADAPAREREARRQVRQLEDTYARQDSARRQGDLLGAWHLAQDVAAIQPDYRDIARRESAAHDALFRQGAGGLVYLQTGGPAPGLYLTRPDGTAAPLPGTTAGSRVYATAPGGRFLYDIGGPAAAGRLAVATVDGAGRVHTDLLPAAVAPGADCRLTAHGTWCTRPDGGLQYDDPARGVAAQAGTFGPDTHVVAGAPAGDGLLLAAGGQGPAGRPQTRLILLNPTGPAHPAAAVPGFLLTADLSPDGRYAALLAEETGAAITRTLYLVDFAAPAAPPRVLDRLAWQGVTLAARLRASFVPGAPAPALVLERQDDSGTAIWRYPLPAGPRTLLWSGADLIQRDEQAGVSPDGQAVAFRAQLDGRPYEVWVPLTAGPPPGVIAIRSFVPQLIDTWFAPRSDFVVYRSRNPGGLDQGTTEAVWTLPAPPAPGAVPRLLTQARRVYDPAFPTLAFPPSGALAAYIAPDAGLHAVALDGTESVSLAAGVEGVWALTP